MEPKKSKDANIEKLKPAMFLMGVGFAAAVVLTSFEMISVDKKITVEEQKEEIQEEEILEYQPPEEPPPPEPETAPPPQIEEIVEVEDEEEIEEIDLDLGLEEDEVVTYEMDDVEEEEVVEAPIYDVVQKMPEFPGGEEARMRYLSENIKYPPMAKESNIQGQVYVQFVVYADGSIKDVKVLRGIGGGCDEEAKRVIKKMPPWNPGEQMGKKVNVKFVMPIRFRLQ